MNKLFTITCLVNMLIAGKFTLAQCIAPELKFANPVLASGTALAEGAIYKFPNITPGIDCYIKMVKLNGGATLVSMETPNQGYPDAWQPIIKGPGTPAGNKSWIDWEISFKTTAGINYTFPCLDISAIDVDGDNSVTGEFIESDGHYGHTLPTPSYITLTDMGNGRLEAQGPVINRPSIDTSALDVRVSFLYNGREKITLKLGSKVFGTGPAATERLNCVYFKRMVMTNYFVLPVSYRSFEALANDNKVNLSWSTDNEVNNNHFVVERSFDGTNFNSVAIVMDALTEENSQRFYGFRDQHTLLTGKTMAWYRLKQVDVKGAFNYSHTLAVKLQGAKNNGMQVAPNPFNQNLSLGFVARERSKATIRLQNTSGQTMITMQANIIKGENTLQVANLGALPRGIYVAQVLVNGIVTHHQKVIKG